MKRLTMVLVAVAALASLASLAVAGDYHVGRLLICSDCHAAHGRADGKMGHSYSTPDGSDTTWWNGAGDPPPYDKLLKGETPNNVCLNCHDKQGGKNIPDVLGITAQSGIPNGRSAGALNVANTNGPAGYTNDLGYAQGDGHSLGWNDLTKVPGGTNVPVDATEGLQCTDCHGAHGNKYFRNLMGGTATYIAAQWQGKEVNYVIGTANLPATNDATTNIAVVEGSAVTNHYDNDNVYYLEPVSTKSAYGDWCGTCHGDFHNNAPTVVGTTSTWKRHPTENRDMTTSEAASWFSWGSKAKALKVMDNTHTWSAAATTMTPTCITCHKSHGNQNPFGLIYVYPNPAVTTPKSSSPTASSTYAPAGDIDARLKAPAAVLAAGYDGSMTEQGNGGEYRDLCRNCHGMGSWATGNPTNLDQ